MKPRVGSIQTKVEFDTREVVAGIRLYEAAMDRIAYELLTYYKPLVERDARMNAAWIDRTSNARRGLRAEVAQLERGAAALILIHGESYGVHLELRYAGRYAIVGPTLESYYAPIRAAMREAVR